MPDPFPPTIATCGNSIHLTLPSPLPNRSHVVTFPATPDGLFRLLRVLRERERAVSAQPGKLGAPGVPTQFLLDTIDAQDKARAAAARAQRERNKGKPLTVADLTEFLAQP